MPIEEEKDEQKESGLDGIHGLDEDDVSKVPSLVAYCEDMLIHQIDIQTVISLYKQAYSMGFHRISVFLSFVIIENIQHLLYFFLRDCTLDEVSFVEHFVKTKYYPQMNMSFAKYYQDPKFLKEKKIIIEKYRILPKHYPNYKSELANVDRTLQQIDEVEIKLNELILKYETETNQNDNDAEVIYFDSGDEENGNNNNEYINWWALDEDEEEDEVEEDKLFSQFNKTPFDRALDALDTKERTLYESKQEVMGDRNRILFKIGNPEQFPSLQMMQKWKKKQKKKENSFRSFVDTQEKQEKDGNKNKNVKKKKFKDDQQFSEIGIASNYDADQYLQHVYLRQTHSFKEHELEQETGLSFSFDYDKYQRKIKSKQQSHGIIIYKKFDVKKAINTDNKKAKKLEENLFEKLVKQQNKKTKQKQKQKQKPKQKQKQKPKRSQNNQSSDQQSLSQINNTDKDSAAKRRRNRKKKKNSNNTDNNNQPPAPSSPKSRPKQQKKPLPQVQSPNVSSQQRMPMLSNNSPRNRSTQNSNFVSSTMTAQSTLSPIEVVRRNREMKKLEQQLQNLNNDVWDLTPKNEQKKKTKNETETE